MMYWNDHGAGGWGFGLMAVVVLLLLALLVAVVVAALRAPGRPAGRPPERRRSDPEEVLAERLARGEIDPDEYRGRLAALRAPADRDGGGAGWTP